MIKRKTKHKKKAIPLEASSLDIALHLSQFPDVDIVEGLRSESLETSCDHYGSPGASGSNETRDGLEFPSSMFRHSVCFLKNKNKKGKNAASVCSLKYFNSLVLSLISTKHGLLINFKWKFNRWEACHDGVFMTPSINKKVRHELRWELHLQFFY